MQGQLGLLAYSFWDTGYIVLGSVWGSCYILSLGYGEAAVVAFFLYFRVFMVSVDMLLQRVLVLASCATNLAGARWPIKMVVFYMRSELQGTCFCNRRPYTSRLPFLPYSVRRLHYSSI